MAERTHNPNSPACGQWETLLADALDGLLRPEDEATFRPTWPSARPARRSLKRRAGAASGWSFSRPEPEVPAGLLDKILAANRPRPGSRLRLVTGGGNICPFRIPSLAASRLHGARPALCRAPADDDGGHGLLLHRLDPQPDRRSAHRSAPFQSASHRHPVLHGAAVDYGLHPDHPLLRPPPPGIRGAVADARAAPLHSGGRYPGSAAKQPATCQPGRIQTESPAQRRRFSRRSSATIRRTGDRRSRLSRDLPPTERSLHPSNEHWLPGTPNRTVENKSDYFCSI